MSDTQKVILDALGLAGTSDAGTSLAEVVKGAIPPVTPGLGENVATIAKQLDLLRTLAQKQAEAVAENTQAVAQNTAGQASRGAASVAGDIAKTAAKTLVGGLSLMPLVSAIVGLFTGNKAETPPPLTTYALPTALNFEGAAPQRAGELILAADYGQDGRPRALPATAPFYVPPITVQVQAMDSRSFLDHSDDIARAVREAILNAHTLSDVVNEL
jgi:hypothetical protein